MAWVRLRDFVLSVDLLLEDLATTGVEEEEEPEQGVDWAVCWNKLEGIMKGAEGEYGTKGGERGDGVGEETWK